MIFFVVTWLLHITNTAGLFHRLNRKYDLSFKTLRFFEKCNSKILKTTCDISFLEQCLKHSCIPKFLKLKDSNNLLSPHTVRERQVRKIALIIKQHRSKLKQLRKKRSKVREDICRYLNVVDKLLFSKFFVRENLKNSKRINEIHKIKFQKLWLQSKLATPVDTVKNLSDLQLSDDQLELLGTGLKHPTVPGRNESLNLQCQLEKLVYFRRNSINVNQVNDIKTALHTYQKGW